MIKKILLITLCCCNYFEMITAQNMQRAVNISAATNNTQALATGVYFIKVNTTGKYLGIEGVNKANGARLVEWDFANQDNHKFFIEQRADGYYTIKALHSNRYLNIAGQSLQDGAMVLQWDFAEQDNVMWTLLKSASLNGWIIRNKQSGKDIKLYGGVNNNVNGTPIVLNSDRAAGAQAFSA